MKTIMNKWYTKAIAMGCAAFFAFFATPMQALADGTVYVSLPPTMAVNDSRPMQQQAPVQVPVSAIESQMVFPAGVSFNDSFAYATLGIVNQQRAAAGLPELRWNAEAAAVAKLRATEIATYFDHTRPDGRDCLTAMDEWGVYNSWRGENIAGGMNTPESVMSVWMDSPGHRSNILHTKFESVGIACCYVPNSEYGIYWVQMFVGYPSSR